jgi:hypothetical protein
MDEEIERTAREQLGAVPGNDLHISVLPEEVLRGFGTLGIDLVADESNGWIASTYHPSQAGSGTGSCLTDE